MEANALCLSVTITQLYRETMSGPNYAVIYRFPRAGHRKQFLKYNYTPPLSRQATNSSSRYKADFPSMFLMSKDNLLELQSDTISLQYFAFEDY